ncbi:Uncharacterized protein PCOAH_00052060 [Plasmodium coatneyi]|uniref:Uncharacterized protein n=1 Tax=Plasmodium coatneyi TaxID=208452 RepID=A0A1B1E794_9APIC|nr:Uncharacterized protein PCOAH_00052060 [Plasmodium coatneyi]ANQ10875.1 Uncharacterized protein PCOAH_00052060 [Plasmodium coatneyi]
MDEYLRKRYLGKETKKDKRHKKSSVKIYDSEEEDRKFHSHIGDDPPLEDDPFVVDSDDSSDVPIVITADNNTEIVNISKESKKKIFLSLKGELTTGKLIEETREEACRKSVKKLRRGGDRCSRGGQRGGSTGGSSNKSDEPSGGDSQSSDFSRDADGGGRRARGDKPRGGRRDSHSNSSDSDLSPPRRLKSAGIRSRDGSGSDSDLSPPRRLKSRRGRSRSDSGSDSDLSPPRRLRSHAGGKRSRSVSSSKHDSEDSNDASDDRESPPSSGKGKKKQAGRSPEGSKNQNVESTIYRDKGGKIISREEWISKQKVDMNAKYRRSGKKGEEDEHQDDEKGKKKKKKKIRTPKN